MNFHSLEAAASGCDINPVTVAKMKDGSGRDDDVRLFLFALKGRGYKHSDFEESRVCKLNTHLGSSYGWIEDRLYVRASPNQGSSWKSIRIDGCSLAERDLRQVILINVAENPKGRHIRDCEHS